MLHRRLQLDRRAFLRGSMSGALCTVGAAPLEAMFNVSGTAYANGAPIPQRLGVWFWGNGVRPDLWKPEKAGAGDQWSLSEELAPLAPFKDKINVLTGYRVSDDHKGVAHHRGRGAISQGLITTTLRREIRADLLDPRSALSRGNTGRGAPLTIRSM